MQTDPIADLLTRVRNACHAKQKKVDIPASQQKIAIVEVWKKFGFVKNYKLYRQEDRGVLRIYLKYADKDRSVIQGIRRVSRPGRRVYRGYSGLPKVLGGLGMAVVSTPKGMLPDHAARENKVGGEVICTIW